MLDIELSRGSTVNLNEDTTRMEKLIDKITENHVKFESIHPFVDGNGRTGRLLMNWIRIKIGLPILVIKESEKFEYYKWFE